jgi:hypothetical protein
VIWKDEPARRNKGILCRTSWRYELNHVEYPTGQYFFRSRASRVRQQRHFHFRVPSLGDTAVAQSLPVSEFDP